MHGHEIATSADGRTAYMPIYGNVGVGKQGLDGREILFIDLPSRKVIEASTSVTESGRISRYSTPSANSFTSLPSSISPSPSSIPRRERSSAPSPLASPSRTCWSSLTTGGAATTPQTSDLAPSPCSI